MIEKGVGCVPNYITPYSSYVSMTMANERNKSAIFYRYYACSLVCRTNNPFILLRFVKIVIRTKKKK